MNGCGGKKITISALFFAYFRELFGGRKKIFDLDAGTTVAGFLDFIGDSPARRAELFEEAGSGRSLVLNPHLVVMINGAGLSSRGGPAAELRDGDTVAVFPLMGGG
ncbi:MAG: MoaD/ThiS family protein [Candidatus Aminicenantales bacterium]